MNPELKQYLNHIDKCLKPLPALERADIIKEIQSLMLEMEHSGFSSQQIIQKLGSPQSLAKEYLGNMLESTTAGKRQQFLAACAFYSLAGFSGMFVVPCLAIISFVFIITSPIAPICGFVKLLDEMLNLNLWYTQYIQVVLPNGMQLDATGVFFTGLLAGGILFFSGYGAWKLLVAYCKKVSTLKKELSV